MSQDLTKLKYILYVSTDAASIRAQRLVPRNSRIAVQNVHQLPSKPEFINGVPFLVRLEDDKMFPGSAALQELQRYWKFLDAHFLLDDTTRVGYVSSSNPSSFAFPLTSPGEIQPLPSPPPQQFVHSSLPQQPLALPPQQQQPSPSQFTHSSLPQQPLAPPPPQQQANTVYTPPGMIPLPPPNISVSTQGQQQGDGLVSLTPQSFQKSAIMNATPGSQAVDMAPPVPIKIKSIGIIPMPPPQDPNAPNTNFNPLHQQVQSGYAPNALPQQPVTPSNSQQPLVTQPIVQQPLVTQPIVQQPPVQQQPIAVVQKPPRATRSRSSVPTLPQSNLVIEPVEESTE